MGGSHFALVNGLSGGLAPTVDPESAKRTFAALHRAIQAGCIRACHDLSEGGLAVAAAEMAFAGGCGARIDLDAVKVVGGNDSAVARLFSESNTRFLCEVAAEHAADFEQMLANISIARVGTVQTEERLVIAFGGRPIVDASLHELKAAWQGGLVG